MWVESLRLVCFRNMAEASLRFSPCLTIILGPNGAGKSNCLEALYLLSRGRSPRTNRDSELPGFGAHEARAAVRVHNKRLNLSQSLDVTFTRQAPSKHVADRFRARFRLNEQGIKQRSDLVGHLATVPFFLSDLLMLRGAPADRRNALDAMLVQWQPEHLAALTQYTRVKEQKGGYLKQCLKLGRRVDEAVLDTYDEQLVMTGSQVMALRMAGLEALQPQAQQYWLALSPEQETLALDYHCAVDDVLEDGEVSRPEQLGQRFAEAIARCRPEEIRRGLVLTGPHRDDFRPTLNGRDACTYASQGQQRSVVLALKLAEIALLKAFYNGESPVLLLDDVMAELDPFRQQQLIRHLSPDMQVILTTTHLDKELKEYVDQVDSAEIISLKGGQIQAVNYFDHGQTVAPPTRVP
ncbi:MAG: DNA replication/repair protein RecF [Cyanobacteria bacterium HKST-UBA06]|nr:DNA replication/repair protein RecF [Cyanobacteria bacterium HKST-UBA06]